MAITFIQWNFIQSTLSLKSLGFVRSVRGHRMQNSLLHAVWNEMCVGSMCTQPPYNDKNKPLFRRRSRCRQECLLSDWGVLLLDVIMNTAVVIYSRHLSRWRRSGLLLFLKGMCPPIYLNAFMFVRIIRDPASPTEEVSIHFFMNLCESAFPNNVLVRKLRS